VTTSGDELPGSLEQIAVELAEGAAGLVRTRRHGQLDVDAKSTSTDLVTEVDRATERWLVGQLAARRPRDAVLGEEGGGREGSSGVRWVLDTIDGTVNFVLGLPMYAVSVAAEVAGRIVAGAVANPASGETFHARLGGGAFLGGARLSGPRAVPLAQAVVGTGFGYDAARRARQGAVVAQLLPRVADVRRLGAAALDLCFLAAGRLDAYFEAGLNAWDFAAGGLIAVEAGCVVSGLHGRAPSEQFYAATGPELGEEFFGLLEAIGADEVSR
jgi:fructose-1,6-bisphosphatase/inositol monophosphatase family enzyme